MGLLPRHLNTRWNHHGGRGFRPPPWYVEGRLTPTGERKLSRTSAVNPLNPMDRKGNVPKAPCLTSVFSFLGLPLKSSPFLNGSTSPRLDLAALPPLGRHRPRPLFPAAAATSDKKDNPVEYDSTLPTRSRRSAIKPGRRSAEAPPPAFSVLASKTRETNPVSHGTALLAQAALPAPSLLFLQRAPPEGAPHHMTGSPPPEV